MIGNSSSGIIEAPTLKTPVINIGSRQNGRVLSDNIISIDEPSLEKIRKSIYFILTNKAFKERVKKCKNKHGTGNASKEIVKILKHVKIDEKLIQKQITY
jgi:UDP-N-acetylglucosamine 2-epimerase (non-hydrolysing)/GDP/UDP-N,N'-diacetylbacillosamine 2-epimerase (hydrolysing)